MGEPRRPSLLVDIYARNFIKDWHFTFLHFENVLLRYICLTNCGRRWGIQGLLQLSLFLTGICIDDLSPWE